MKLNSFIALLMILSSILSEELIPITILEKSINRLNNQDISFLCDIELQSLSKDPTNLTFQFYSYWLDSTNYYTYLKFKSPIDYKGTEVWGHFSEEIVMKKRMPINNQIVKIEDGFESLDIVKFLNFSELFDNIKEHELSINEVKFNTKEVYVIKSHKKESKKKSIKFYLDKDKFFIYKVEWNNKRGVLNKILLFEDWKMIDGKQFPSSIIYEDIKKGLKTTCKLNKISFDSLNKEAIDLMKIGFKND